VRRAIALLVLLGCGGADAPPPAEPEQGPGPVVAVALRFEEGPTDQATDTPSTRVVLVAIAPEEGRATAEVGTFEGVCQHAPPVGVVLAARCWWAGFGTDVQVRRDGDELVAYTARVDEQTPATEPAEAARLGLPERAELDPLLPAAYE